MRTHAGRCPDDRPGRTDRAEPRTWGIASNHPATRPLPPTTPADHTRRSRDHPPTPCTRHELEPPTARQNASRNPRRTRLTLRAYQTPTLPDTAGECRRCPTRERAGRGTTSTAGRGEKTRHIPAGHPGVGGHTPGFPLSPENHLGRRSADRCATRAARRRSISPWTATNRARSHRR